jgi:excisionase family DNA binding protein
MDCHLPPEATEFAWPAPLMTAAEVAAVLRVTPKTVRRHIRRGSLGAIRLEGAGPYRVRREDAQRWAEQQVVEPDLGALAVDRYVARRMPVPAAPNGDTRSQAPDRPGGAVRRGGSRTCARSRRGAPPPRRLRVCQPPGRWTGPDGRRRNPSFDEFEVAVESVTSSTAAPCSSPTARPRGG